MSAWLGFWWMVLIGAFLCYVAVTVLVSLRAFGDVRALLRYLNQEHEREAVEESA